jgi:uncharacterized protein (DUF488 family)
VLTFVALRRANIIGNLIKNRCINYLKKQGVNYLHFDKEFGARYTDKALLDDNDTVDFEKVRAEVAYLNLLDSRKIKQKVDVESLHQHCLLCSEYTPEKCHRRLIAEYFQAVRQDIEIVHLIK